MALQKTHESAHGASGDYWKVTKVEVDWDVRYLRCLLKLFVNQAAANANKTHLELKDYFFADGDFDVTSSDDLSAACYNKIKASDAFFVDAVDVFEEGQP